MRILLTGTTGQVGGALLAILRDKHEVIAPSRSTFDFSAPQSLGYTLNKFAPDLIINPAAYTAVDRAEEEPELGFNVINLRCAAFSMRIDASLMVARTVHRSLFVVAAMSDRTIVL